MSILSEAPLWVDGEFWLRVRGPEAGSNRIVRVGRPFALVGRAEGSDVRIEDGNVSTRHAYLHLDRRGLFAVDLATRNGTRFADNARQVSGWLRPGEALGIAGHRVELMDVRLHDGEAPPPVDEPPPDLLADASHVPLVRVTLYPVEPAGTPQVLGSELVFLGRGHACGVRIEGNSAARTHCVLARTHASAYIVDLVGRGTTVNDRPVEGASPLIDGDRLTIGAARYEVRVEPAGSGRPGRSLAMPEPAGAPAPAWRPADGAGAPLPAESQGAVLAWLMGALQASQGEAIRRQDEFQENLLRLVQKVHHDNTALLSQHLERMEGINRELAALRDEIRQRLGPDVPGLPAGPSPRSLAPPSRPPVPRPPRPAPADGSTPPPADPEVATQWLIGRLGQLEEENRSTWRSLLDRLAGHQRRVT